MKKIEKTLYSFVCEKNGTFSLHRINDESEQIALIARTTTMEAWEAAMRLLSGECTALKKD